MNSRSTPTFSVIIPTYNRAALIQVTLNSVIEQTFFAFEIIIVDDGSTDDTENSIAPYLKDSRIMYYKIKNSERGAARNYGVSKSRGRFITFLDSDDVFLPWHLATAAEKIKHYESPRAFHLGYEILHFNGKVDSLTTLPSPVNDKLLEGNFLSCMGVFLRRDVAVDNPFDEDLELSGSEDYELWMRVAARVPILAFPEVTSRLINHENRSVITTSPKKLIARLTILDKKLQADEKFRVRFGDRLKIFTAYRNLYMSLHLALSGERLMALKGLWFTLKSYPYVILNYRFGVALKKTIFW